MVSGVNERLSRYTVKVARDSGWWRLLLYDGCLVGYWPLEGVERLFLPMAIRIRIAVGFAVKKAVQLEGLSEKQIRDAKQAEEFTKLASEMFAKAIKEVR